MMKKILIHFRHYKSLSLYISISIAILFVYNLKLHYTLAFDPQVSIAHRIAFNLSGGESIEELESEGLIPQVVDGVFSQQPYVLILDHAGKTVLNTAVFGEEVPTIPEEYLLKEDWTDNRYLWSPIDDNMQAIVVMSYTNTTDNTVGYVVSGRDFTETKNRYNEFTLLFIEMWLSLMAVFVLIPGLITYYTYPKKLK